METNDPTSTGGTKGMDSSAGDDDQQNMGDAFRATAKHPFDSSTAAAATPTASPAATTSVTSMPGEEDASAKPEADKMPGE